MTLVSRTFQRAKFEVVILSADFIVTLSTFGRNAILVQLLVCVSGNLLWSEAPIFALPMFLDSSCRFCDESALDLHESVG